MDRIVIIGSPGAGKSTLARILGRKLHIRVVHLDRIFWEPGWKEKPRETRIDILQKIVQEKQWIIEGTYLGASEPRFIASDTIIFLDIPFYICLKRIFVQRFLHQGEHRPDLNEGCKDRLTLKRNLKVLVFPVRGRWILINKLKGLESRNVIKLHSAKEVESFLALLGQQASEDQIAARASSAPKNRHPALA